MPYFISDTIGTGADAEGNQIRPAIALHSDAWTVTADAPGLNRMLVKCAHMPVFDGDARIRPIRRALLANVAPDDGEVDDWEASVLAAKIARRFLVRQWLGADDFAVTVGALDATLGDIPAARRGRIRNRLLLRGINIDGLTLSTSIADALRFILPQFKVRLEPKAASPGGTFTDNFTEASDTALQLHTPSGGTAWTRVEAIDAAIVKASDNTLWTLAASSTNTLYQCDDQGNAGQYLQFKVTDTSSLSLVCNRATNASNFIGVRTNGATPKVQIFKRVSGSFTQLGSDGATTVAVGDTIKLESDGDAHEAFLNGLSLVGPSTDTAHNTVTRQGVCAREGTNGTWLDDFEAGTLEPPPAQFVPRSSMKIWAYTS